MRQNNPESEKSAKGFDTDSKIEDDSLSCFYGPGDAEELFRIFSSIPDTYVCVITVRKNGDFAVSRVNENWTRATGFTRQELLTPDLWPRALKESDVPHFINFVRDAAIGRATETAARIITKSGSSFPMSLFGFPLFSGRVLLIGRDLTEKKKADTSRKEFASLARAFMNAPVALAVVVEPETGLILDCNELFANRFGKTREETIGLLSSAIMPQDLFEYRLEKTREAVKACSAIRYEDNRGNYYYDHVVYPIVDECGRASRILFISLDISERKRAERLSRASEKRLKSLLELSRADFSTEKELVEYWLDQAVSITGSRFGYLFFTDESAPGHRVFFWSKNAAPGFRDAVERYYGYIGNEWPESLNSGLPLIHRDFACELWQMGLQVGHLNALNHLCMSLVKDGAIRIVCGVADKGLSYEDLDVVQLQLYLEGLWGRVLRLRANHELHHQHAVSAALADLYKPLTAPFASTKRISRIVLQKALALTESPHGFVSAVDPLTRENMAVNYTHLSENGSISIRNDDRRLFCAAENGCYKALCGHCLNTRRAFYLNDVSGHPKNHNMPQGHIEVSRFLAVPVILADELLGQIALANKNGEYTEKDIQAVTRLAEFYSLALQRKRSEDSLKRAKDDMERGVIRRTAELNAQIAERRALQEMLLSLFNGITDPLMVLDKNMKVAMLNKAAMIYHGVEDIDRARGRQCFSVFNNLRSPCPACEIGLSVMGGRPGFFERRKPGEPGRIEEVAVFPVGRSGTGASAAADYSIIYIRDVTESKHYQRSMAQSEKLAALGFLISGIAHEINNPNSFITFNIPILKNFLQEILPYLDKDFEGQNTQEICGLPYSEFRVELLRLLENISYGSSRINTIVKNLNQFSRKKEHAEIKTVHIGQVVEQGFSLCHGKIRHLVRNLYNEIPKNIPPVTTDPEMFVQVLVNLLINAAQASDKEDSFIRIFAFTENGDRRQVVLCVEDNGQGMDEATAARIFDPFFTTKRPGVGTGLGLSICHQLVEAMGGRIWVSSEVGRGSRFYVAFPAVDGK